MAAVGESVGGGGGVTRQYQATATTAAAAAGILHYQGHVVSSSRHLHTDIGHQGHGGGPGQA